MVESAFTTMPRAAGAALISLQRDPSLARHDGPQVVRVLLQQGTPVAANLRRGRAAGLAHPLHQLDGRRGAHGKAAGRLPDRAAIFDSPHDPLT